MNPDGRYGLKPEQVARINAFLAFLDHGMDRPPTPLEGPGSEGEAVFEYFQAVTRDLMELWLAVQREAELHDDAARHEAWLPFLIVRMGSNKRFEEALHGLR